MAHVTPCRGPHMRVMHRVERKRAGPMDPPEVRRLGGGDAAYVLLGGYFEVARLVDLDVRIQEA